MLDELRSRFDRITDEPSRLLCSSLVHAILAVQYQIEYLASFPGKQNGKRAQVEALRQILTLCREHGQYLVDAHPNSLHLQMRVNILIQMTGEMLADELEAEYEPQNSSRPPPST